MTKVIHNIHFPVSARSFVAPLVASLNYAGIATELWLEYQDEYIQIIQDIEVPKRFIKSNLSLNPIQIFQNLWIYYHQLRMAKPKVLHTHQTRASLIPLLAGFLAKVPIRVYHNHGCSYLGHHGILRLLLRGLEQVNIALSTHVLMVSDSNLSEVKKDGLLSRKEAIVLGYGSAVGIDLDRFEVAGFSPESQQKARQKWGIDSYQVVLAYVGRPVEHKGFHHLLRTWLKMQLGEKGYCLLMAGCTEQDCYRVVGSLPLQVKALGYLKDLQEFYAACDVVVLPSNYEGFPYALLEGAAAGKPLIGTDIPGIRCAIVPQETGLLVPPKDEEALAAAIIQLAQDADLRQQMGKKARERVEREFSQEFVLGKLLEFYEQKLGLERSELESET